MNKAKIIVGILFISLLLTACSSPAVNTSSSEKNETTSSSSTESVEVTDDFLDMTIEIEKFDLHRFNNREPDLEVEMHGIGRKGGKSFSGLNENSSVIVKGTIVDVSFVIERGMPHTVSTVKIDESLKGELKTGSLISVVQVGGYMTLQDEIDWFGGESRFSSVAKSEWANTLIEKKYGNAEFPEKGQEFIYFLYTADSEYEDSLSGTVIPFSGAYIPFTAKMVVLNSMNKPSCMSGRLVLTLKNSQTL